MASYELMFIVRPELDDEQVTTATDRVHQLIVANDGSVTKTAAWGKRRLAYQVGQYNEGYYVVSNFEIAAPKIAELERVLKISDTVFRHLLVRRDAPAVGQTEVVVPEATPEEIAAMYEPTVTEEEAEAAPPAVSDEDENDSQPAEAAPAVEPADTAVSDVEASPAPVEAQPEEDMAPAAATEETADEPE